MSNEQTLREYLKRVTIELGEERERLQALRHEPIAIVGMACRYPGGVASPADLWRLVSEGRDAIGELPRDRGWDGDLFDPRRGVAGKSYVAEGGFIHDMAEFDAGFFGISPREALASDPQQRLLLETAWEALEDAALLPADLRGSATGVFTGVNASDYASMVAPDEELDGYRLFGASPSIASGRVAYTLGLEGPAITIDTACSSSLVAMHLAAQALRAGECSLALAGGVTMLASPIVFTEFSRQGAMAADARCKAFADAADGTSWGEGVGLLALQRLSDAERNGHRVHAVIRGSALNQDGASNGLTAPNGPSQERVIRQALESARLGAAEVDAVEAHGTGTTLGDPIEAGALLATYGQDRETPLKLGSIKSNIGHTQAAAGVAGVIKMTMAMREGVLPKTLHVDAPSQKVDWEAGRIELLTENAEWQANGRPRRAGVSAFGASGTNAHLVLEQAPPREQAERGGDGEGSPLGGALPFVLSAKEPQALRDAASSLAGRLREDAGAEGADLAYSLATTRSGFPQRAAVVAADREDLLSGLDALAAGEEAANLVLGSAAKAQPPVFLFPGQGSQSPRMAVALAEQSAFFAAQLDACEEALEPFVEWSLREVLRDSDAGWLERLGTVQPALFAVMVSLARLWQACGVEPVAVAGHSQGEIAAAHVAGGLSLEDAARVVALRARAMEKISGKGTMASLALSEAELEPILAAYAGRVSLAALNGPRSLVVSGEVGALEELVASCEADGVHARRIAVDYAAHSAQIEALEAELLEAFAPISPRGAEIPFYSTVSAERTDAAELGPEYWYRNLREPVRLAPVVRSLLGQGHRTLIEVGPHPVLGFAVQETIDEEARQGEEAVVIGTLRRDEGGARRFALSLAQAQVAGASVDWQALFAAHGPRVVPLPTYPFQRKRYWIDPALTGTDPAAIGLGAIEHALLAARVDEPGGGLTLTGRLSLGAHPWLADHVVAGAVSVPAAAFVEMALAAGAETGCELLEELALEAPLVLSEDGGAQVWVRVEPAGERGERAVSIHSRPQEDAEEEEPEWACHARGVLLAAPLEGGEPLGAWPPAGAEPIGTDAAYDRLAGAGLDHGLAFQGLTRAWRAGEEICAEVSLAEDEASGAARFGVHPALLDAAFHAGFELLPADEGAVSLRRWQNVGLAASGAGSLRVRLRRGEEPSTLSLQAYDEAGTRLLAVGAATAAPIEAGALRSPSALRSLYGLSWQPLDEDEAGEAAPAELVELAELGFEPGADLAARAHAATAAALAMVQNRVSAAGEGEIAPLALLTRGAVAAVPGEDCDPAAAAVWGLLRSAQSEHPGRFALIDSDGSEASRRALERAPAFASAEPQLALREGKLLVPRVGAGIDGSDWLTPPPGPWRLDAAERGSLDGLALLPAPEASPPGEGMVRIDVRAAGLNFRDVMAVLGVYPGSSEIGGEGAGVITAVGPGVERFEVGDRVMGLLAGAFAPQATADQRLLVEVPDDWSFAEAAAAPMAYCTARYGLRELADLQPGQRVLIHAAAGGVGSAAVAIAQQRGAEVFATAGPAKWEALEVAGIPADHIASSRDLSFEQRFLELTGGEGVEVVLNSLAGDFVDASLRLLPRGGCFLELGKADVRDAEELAAAHPGVSYRAFSLSEAGPERIGAMLGELIELRDRGELSLPAPGSWDIRRAPAAFRHLREGRNVGKVVLEIPRPIDPERTVLITGATGGLGALLAVHLVERHGARRLLLLSRSGAEADGAAELAERLAELGAEARIESCDVAERERLGELIGSIDPAHPLGAVIHAAGVSDGSLLESMSAERLDRVLAAKVDGACNLHELTAAHDLSAFVLFSSFAGILGSPGLGNYAAANVFLDALAAHRQADGLPGTSIAWGTWERGEGMISQLDEADRARAARLGIMTLSDEEGLELFDAALLCGRPFTVAARIDPRGLGRLAAIGGLPPILAGIARRRGARRAASISLAEQLDKLPAAEHEAAVLELVREEVAAVLGHASAAEVAPERPFKDLGFDSLAAVELRNRLVARTAMRLPATLVFDYPTAAAAASHLLAEAKPGEQALAVGELGRLERALAALPPSDPSRPTLAAHLRGLAADLEAEAAGDRGDAELDRLEAASDQELFEFIDAQVGSS
jgi:polyketide synthase 12